VFILVANWSSLVPGNRAADRTARNRRGLAVLVFLSVIWFGMRGGGVGGWLKSFAAPNPVMIPLNILQSLTRVFSMFVRLFGNVMSGVFVIGIVASLAGLLVPIPLMALDLLTGLVQAYIFAVLAMVFITAAVEDGAPPAPKADLEHPNEKGFLMDYLRLASIFCAAFAVAFGAIGPALAEGAPLPPRWTPSPDSPMPRTRSRARSSSGSR
jgi:hypothetical protein